MTFSKKITSSSNEEIKSLTRLHANARERRKSGQLILEGFHLVQTALDAGLTIQEIYLDENHEGHPDWIRMIARIGNTRCTLVSTAILAKITSLTTAPEIIAVGVRPASSLLAAGGAVMLDGVRDPGNIGTILRSAAAANVRNVYLSADCADVYSPKVLRAAMGAHFSLNISEQADLVTILQGWPATSIATSLEQSCSLYETDLRGDVALVFGNEGSGVSRAVLNASQLRVRIPMPGEAESLNVAMAATICLFERVRQLQVN